MVNRDFGPCASAVEEESIVTWAVRCLREQDPHSSTADVSVQGRGLIGQKVRSVDQTSSTTSKTATTLL